MSRVTVIRVQSNQSFSVCFINSWSAIQEPWLQFLATEPLKPTTITLILQVLCPAGCVSPPRCPEPWPTTVSPRSVGQTSLVWRLCCRRRPRRGSRSPSLAPPSVLTWESQAVMEPSATVMTEIIVTLHLTQKLSVWSFWLSWHVSDISNQYRPALSSRAKLAIDLFHQMDSQSTNIYQSNWGRWGVGLVMFRAAKIRTGHTFNIIASHWTDSL